MTSPNDSSCSTVLSTREAGGGGGGGGILSSVSTGEAGHGKLSRNDGNKTGVLTLSGTAHLLRLRLRLPAPDAVRAFLFGLSAVVLTGLAFDALSRDPALFVFFLGVFFGVFFGVVFGVVFGVGFGVGFGLLRDAAAGLVVFVDVVAVFGPVCMGCGVVLLVVSFGKLGLNELEQMGLGSPWLIYSAFSCRRRAMRTWPSCASITKSIVSVTNSKRVCVPVASCHQTTHLCRIGQKASTTPCRKVGTALLLLLPPSTSASTPPGFRCHTTAPSMRDISSRTANRFLTASSFASCGVCQTNTV